jgi:hypothetical protein
MSIEELDLPIDEQSDKPPWKQKEVLDELLNERGWTYGEVSEAFDGATEQKVGNAAREADVNPGRGVEAISLDEMASKAVKTYDGEVEGETPEDKLRTILDELFHQRGYTYEEAAEWLDVGVNQVADRARQLDVNPGRLRPAYTEDVVPVGCSTSEPNREDQSRFIEYEHPIPEHIAHEEALDLRRPYYSRADADEIDPETLSERERQGSLVRYMIGIEDGDIVALMDMRPDREGRGRRYSNERRVSSRPGNQFLLARYPRALARIIGLNQPAESDREWEKGTDAEWRTGRAAQYFLLDRDTALVRFDPSLESAVRNYDEDSVPVSSEGARPEPTSSKPLVALNEAGDTVVDSPDLIDKYRLELPLSYGRTYDFLEDGESEYVAVKYGKVHGAGSDGHNPPAIIFDTNPDIIETEDDEDGTEAEDDEDGTEAEDDEIELEGPGVLRTVMTMIDAETRARATREIKAINIPMSLVHAMGIGVGEGVGTVKPSVELLPGDDWFAIRPTKTQSIYNPLDHVEQN